MRLHSGCWLGLQVWLDCRICFQAPSLGYWQASHFCWLLTRGLRFSPCIPLCSSGCVQHGKWLPSERATKMATSESLNNLRLGVAYCHFCHTKPGILWEERTQGWKYQEVGTIGSHVGGWLPRTSSVSRTSAVVMLCNHSICDGLSFGFSCIISNSDCLKLNLSSPFPCPSDFFKWSHFFHFSFPSYHC